MLDYITVISPEQASYFKEFVAPDKIQLILHGIDIGYFRPGTEPKEENKVKCITVGYWLRDFKAVREVARALSGYRNIEFHIVSSQTTEVEDLANVTVYRGIDVHHAFGYRVGQQANGEIVICVNERAHRR